MQKIALPRISNHYWLAIFVASVLGTTCGDYISSGLGLGCVWGLIPLFIIFMTIMLIGCFSDFLRMGLYWAAVVVSRTAATNIADLTTHRCYWHSVRRFRLRWSIAWFGSGLSHPGLFTAFMAISAATVKALRCHFLLGDAATRSSSRHYIW